MKPRVNPFNPNVIKPMKGIKMRTDGMHGAVRGRAGTGPVRDTYRAGRVILLGDVVHMNSPASRHVQLVDSTLFGGLLLAYLLGVFWHALSALVA